MVNNSFLLLFPCTADELQTPGQAGAPVPEGSEAHGQGAACGDHQKAL